MMQNQLRALAVFAQVAEVGSFSEAAKRLGISPSVVSHHVTALEQYLDTPLIYRTTRKLSLTSAGEHLAIDAMQIVRIAESGFVNIRQQKNQLTGVLRITALAILQYARFVIRLSTFIKHHPKVDIQISFTDRRINMVEEGYDLSFRVGQLEDSSLISKKLADGRLLLCAAPDYLQTRDPVRHPRDLQYFEQISLTGVSSNIRVSPVSENYPPEISEYDVQMKQRISSDSGFAARRMAEAGCGIVLLPDFFVRDRIEKGHLVEVLPDWQSTHYGIFALWPANSTTNYLRKSFLDFVGTIAKNDPAADREIPVQAQ
jgi:DNA-binding transcriptional LysR family regulator